MPGGSVQHQYERIRDQRRERLRQRRSWFVAVGLAAVIAAYVTFEALIEAGALGALIAILMIIPKLLPTQREAAWRRGRADRRRRLGCPRVERLGGAPRSTDPAQPRQHRSHRDWASRRLHDRREALQGQDRGSAWGLFVNGRDRSKLLDQARRQRDVVSEALAAGGYGDVDVTPVLCFTGAEWPLLFPPRSAGDVLLCSSKGLPRTLDFGQEAKLSPRSKTIADHLAGTLNPAEPSGQPSAGDGQAGARAESDQDTTRGPIRHAATAEDHLVSVPVRPSDGRPHPSHRWNAVPRLLDVPDVSPHAPADLGGRVVGVGSAGRPRPATAH